MFLFAFVGPGNAAEPTVAVSPPCVSPAVVRASLLLDLFALVGFFLTAAVPEPEHCFEDAGELRVPFVDAAAAAGTEFGFRFFFATTETEPNSFFIEALELCPELLRWRRRRRRLDGRPSPCPAPPVLRFGCVGDGDALSVPDNCFFEAIVDPFCFCFRFGFLRLGHGSFRFWFWFWFCFCFCFGFDCFCFCFGFDCFCFWFWFGSHTVECGLRTTLWRLLVMPLVAQQRFAVRSARAAITACCQLLRLHLCLLPLWFPCLRVRWTMPQF